MPHRDTKCASPVDLVHLAHQTLGDRSLEREVLQLFSHQSRIYLERLRAGVTDAERRMAAHTILGSARGIGAWAVAEAAQPCERDHADPRRIDALDAALVEANAYIDNILQ